MFGLGSGVRILPEIDSEQRWLVRHAEASARRRRRKNGRPEVFDVTIGEVSASGHWFKVKPEVYSHDELRWHSRVEFEWLEQLI